MRIKYGMFTNDLGFVERINDTKVILRLVPRLELSGGEKKKSNKFMKIP